MKKITTALFVLFILFSFTLFGCASSGGGGGSQPAPTGEVFKAAGHWEGSSDSLEGGMSTLTMTEQMMDGVPAYNFTGHVPTEGTGIAWPWVNIEFIPDEESINAFKKAAAVSIMVQGNGAEYTIRYHVDNVTDWAWHGYTFIAPAQPTKIEVPLTYFMQPSWGVFKRLDPSRFTMMSITPVGYNINYDITIWDLQIIQ